MKTRLELAHDWVMKFGDSEYPNMTIEKAWDYADAMLAEDAKRNIPEKQDSSEWQPDWSQAPDHMDYYALDQCGNAYWYVNKPSLSLTEFIMDCTDCGGDCWKNAPTFDYTGNWRDSLRKRPK